jgi:5-methyltetrahydropteroyltriglutamate--homocysteine methyltransferase
MFALADAMHEEYAAIADAGLYVQIDDAFLPYMYDMAFADKDMESYRQWCRLRIDALNHALRGIPEEKVRYHICWGSFNSPHTSDVPFKAIADLVLSVNAGGYSIEMANPRHEHE